MNINTKAALITVGVPAIAGAVGALPGILIAQQGASSTTFAEDGNIQAVSSSGSLMGIGIAVAFVGGVLATFYTARVIIK